MEASEIVVLLVALAFGLGIVLLFCCIVGKGLQVGCKGCVGGGAGRWCGGCGGAGKAARGCCGDVCQSATSCCTSGFRWCGSCCKGAAKDLENATVAQPKGDDVESGDSKREEEYKVQREPLLAVPTGKCAYRGEQRVDRINDGCHGWLSSWCVDCVFLNRLCCDCSWLEMDRASETASTPLVAVAQPVTDPPPPPGDATPPPPNSGNPFLRLQPQPGERRAPGAAVALPALMLPPQTVLRTR